MSYAVTNPATGETVKTFDTITDAGLEAAIASAENAYRTWSKTTTVQERAALVRRVGELHVERRQELADIIVREMGKPVEQALGEVDFAGAIYEYYADHASEFLKDEPITLLDGGSPPPQPPARSSARVHPFRSGNTCRCPACAAAAQSCRTPAWYTHARCGAAHSRNKSES